MEEGVSHRDQSKARIKTKPVYSKGGAIGKRYSQRLKGKWQNKTKTPDTGH